MKAQLVANQSYFFSSKNLQLILCCSGASEKKAPLHHSLSLQRRRLDILLTLYAAKYIILQRTRAESLQQLLVGTAAYIAIV